MASGHPDFQSFENLINNGDLKRGTGGAQNSTTTLYTTPAGKIAYVVSLNYNWKIIANNDGGSGGIQVANTYVLVVNATDTLGLYGVTNISFPVPLKLTAGQTLRLTSLGDGILSYGSYSVYEVSI